MKTKIAIVALSLLVLGCNTPSPNVPSSSSTPGVNQSDGSASEAEQILKTIAQKAEPFTAVSAENGFPPLLASLNKEETALAVYAEANETWENDGPEGLALFAAEHQQFTEAYKPAKALLETALAKPKFHPVLSFDVTAPTPNFMNFLNLHRGLLLNGLLLAEKDLDAATDLTLLCLRSAARLSGTGNLLTQTVSNSLKLDGFMILSSLLGAENLTVGQAKKIQDALATLSGSVADYSFARDIEFISQYQMLNNLEDGTLEGDDISEELKSGKLDLEEERKALDMLFLNGRNEIANLKDVKVAQDEIVKKIEANPKVILGKISAPSLDDLYLRARQSRSAMGGAQLLTAIRLYQLENGKAPENLDVLVPNLLKSLPTNPLTENGQYQYTLDGDSFTLSDGAADEPFQFYP